MVKIFQQRLGTAGDGVREPRLTEINVMLLIDVTCVTQHVSNHSHNKLN
jgi:hypothetical protein